MKAVLRMVGKNPYLDIIDESTNKATNILCLTYRAAYERAVEIVNREAITQVMGVQGKLVDIKEMLCLWAEQLNYEQPIFTDMGQVRELKKLGYPLRLSDNIKWNWYVKAIDRGMKALAEQNYDSLDKAEEILRNGMLKGFENLHGLKSVATRMATILIDVVQDSNCWDDLHDNKLSIGGINKFKSTINSQWSNVEPVLTEEEVREIPF